MFKFLNQCFARLRFWKSVSSKTAVAPPSRFRESETLFQNRSRAKHWFKNLNILIKPLLFLLFRLFRIKVHNNFAQADDVFAEDATVEGTDGPIDASAIRKRIYSGILEGKEQIIA